MIQSTIDLFKELGVKKAAMLQGGLARYFVLAMLAGIYVGLGIILIFSVGGPFDAVKHPAVKLVMGVSFGVALTLVVFAGSELFTGNNMVMTISSLSGRTTWRQAAWLWVVSFTGNLAGSLLLAYAMGLSGLLNEGGGHDLLVKATAGKMHAPMLALFVRAILCNMLVCLAVWTAARAKDDTAKILLIFWCLFAFIGSGFEHSVANMTLLGTALFVPHDPTTVTWLGFARNLVPVTLGNMVGGGLFIGAAYWFAAGPVPVATTEK